MKIKAKNTDIKSMKLSVPLDGIIEIDANGVAEVSAKCGKMLIEGTNDWKELKDDTEDDDQEKVDEQGSKDGEQDATDTDDDTEGGEDDGDGEKQPTDEEIIEGLKKLSLEDCIATAKEAGYPEKEWKKLSENKTAAEKMMRNYLVKKYKESVK